MFLLWQPIDTRATGTRAYKDGAKMIEFAIILVFVVWRVTSLLFIESPFDWLRTRLGIYEDDATGVLSYPVNIIGTVWECFWCLSLVVAFVFAVMVFILTDLNIFECFLLWLGSSAGAIVIDARFFARHRG